MLKSDRKSIRESMRRRRNRGKTRERQGIDTTVGRLASTSCVTRGCPASTARPEGEKKKEVVKETEEEETMHDGESRNKSSQRPRDIATTSAVTHHACRKGLGVTIIPSLCHISDVPNYRNPSVKPIPNCQWSLRMQARPVI